MRTKILFNLAVTAALALSALTGCDALRGDKAHDEKKPPTYMIYSPNGEPLNGGQLGKPTCEQAMSGWFGRVSAGGATISKEAFLSDAHVLFGRMDIDHRGYIVSEELDRFREPYRQQQPAGKQEEEDSSGKKQGKGKHGNGTHASAGGGLSDPSLSIADPVMSADTNLDFKVTPEEFMKKTETTFVRLDGNHDGFLDRAEIMTLCKQDKK